MIINNIRRVIRSKGLKQCVVAEKAGFTPNAFSSMLNERKAIMAEYIPDIALALGRFGKPICGTREEPECYIGKTFWARPACGCAPCTTGGIFAVR